jgi:hypothetical protein
MLHSMIFSFFILTFLGCQHASEFDGKEEMQNQAKPQLTATEKLENQFCSTTKEFITTYEYLKTKETYFQPKWAQKTARDVSVGCKGAAVRFIKVFELMTKADAYGQDAADLGILAANSTDEVTESFIETFQKSFLKKYLDLDLASSVKLAKGLSFKYEGKVKNAEDDFGKLVKFCTSETDLNLSKPVCAKMAYRVALYGQNTPNGIFPAFKRSFQFLTSSAGPKVTTETALKVSEKLVKVSPMAVYNFVKAYEYGMKEKGLGLQVAEAVQFATYLGEKSERLPASQLDPKNENPTDTQR